MSSTKILVEAITRQRYNGVWYVPGETFEVESESEFDDMVASRPPLVKRAKAKYETRALSAGEETPPVAAVTPTAAQNSGKNGKYDRRDLRAR